MSIDSAVVQARLQRFSQEQVTFLLGGDLPCLSYITPGETKRGSPDMWRGLQAWQTYRYHMTANALEGGRWERVFENKNYQPTKNCQEEQRENEMSILDSDIRALSWQ